MILNTLLISTLIIPYSLPKLQYAWDSKVLERREERPISYTEYRREHYPRYKATLSDVEEEVIRVLAHRNITDINAVATVLGNIQQESGFKVNALNASEGSFGLIQWRLERRNRLESYCKDLNDVRCQLFFMVSESDWAAIESDMQITGQSIEYYNGLMKKNLRWGIEGNRVKYAYEYSRSNLLSDLRFLTSK